MTAHQAQSLKAKLQRFADGLTAEETAQLHQAQTDDVTRMLSTSLWEKAQEVADTLTPEEQSHLHQLLRDARAARGDEADTTGHMVNLYESNASDPTEGRPRPLAGSSGGGGGLVPFSGSTLGLAVLGFAGTLAGAEDNQTQGGYYPTPR